MRSENCTAPIHFLNKASVLPVFKKGFALYGCLLFFLCSASVNGIAQPPDIISEQAIILSDYIQKKSVSGSENEAGIFLAEVCKKKNLHVEVLSAEAGNFNFAASLYPLHEQRPNIIFLNHIDVVPEGNQLNWKYPPFDGVIAENKIWGRGAIDLKGVAVMQLAAIQKAREWFGTQHSKYNVTLLCVSGEESDNEGIRSTIENHFERLNPVVAFGEGGTGVAEMTNARPQQAFFGISVSEKKALWLKLSLSVKTSGHGSVPPPAYANKIITKSLNRLLDKSEKIVFDEITINLFKTLGKYEKGARRLALRHPFLCKALLKKAVAKDPLVKSTVSNTITITNINNYGVATNQIAQDVEVLLDCRLLPGTDPVSFIRNIQKTLNNNEIKLTVVKETPSAPISEISGFYEDFKSVLEQVYEGSAITPILCPAHSDNNFLRQRGIPVYGITPVLLSKEQLLSFHNNNEYISLQQLADGTKVYEKLLHRIAANASPHP